MVVGEPLVGDAPPAAGVNGARVVSRPLGQLLLFDFRLMDRFSATALGQARVSFVACLVAVGATLVVLLTGSAAILATGSAEVQVRHSHGRRPSGRRSRFPSGERAGGTGAAVNRLSGATAGTGSTPDTRCRSRPR